MAVWSHDALDDVAWHRLSHAYGTAADTPRHLRGLTAADTATRESALAHLWGWVTHQESLYTATAPVAELVARTPTDHRLDSAAPGGEKRSMCAALLSYLGHVAAWAASFQARLDTVAYVRRDDQEVGVYDVVWEPEDDPDHVVVGRLGSGCARRAATVMPLLVPWLDAPDPQEREAALYAVACWAGLAGDHDRYPVGQGGASVPRRHLARRRRSSTSTTPPARTSSPMVSIRSHHGHGPRSTPVSRT